MQLFINIFLEQKNNVSKKNIFAYKYYQKYFNNLKILNKLLLLLNKLKTNKQTINISTCAIYLHAIKYLFG